jgi:DNA-binding XRE family transcriptional regulator
VKVIAKNTFREIRIKSGFSTVTLAEKIGTSKQNVGQIERRVNGIAPDKAKVVTELFGVSFDDIFELVERENASHE